MLGMNPQIAWEGGWSFVIRAINTGLSFVATVLLARLLGAENYGVFSFALALVTLLIIPAQFGLPTLIVRETASGMALDHPELVKGVWRWSGWLVGGLSLAIALFAGPVLYMWRTGESSIQGLTLAWALALIPLISLGNLRGAALRGLKKIVAGQLPEYVIRPGLFTLLLIGAIILTSHELSAPLAMVFRVLSSLIAFVIGAWMLKRNTPSIVSQARPTYMGRIWFVSSLMFALIASFHVIYNQVSTLILGLFESPDQVGIYRVAVQVAMLASFGLQAVNIVVAPRFADLHAQGKIIRLQHLVTSTARIILVFNLVLTAIFILIGRPFFILVFGPDFAASYFPLVILLVGQMVNSATGSVGLLLNMTGHERETARGMAVAAAINVTVNLLLIPMWGIQGAAIATSISMVAWNILLWWAVRQHLGINSLAFSIGKKHD